MITISKEIFTSGIIKEIEIVFFQNIGSIILRPDNRNTYIGIYANEIASVIRSYDISNVNFLQYVYTDKHNMPISNIITVLA